MVAGDYQLLATGPSSVSEEGCSSTEGEDGGEWADGREVDRWTE